MKRPFGVTILIVMVLIFTSLNALQASTAIRLWGFLIEPPLDTPVINLVTTGIIWSVLGIALAVGLFTRRKWSSPLVKTSAVVYAVFYWVDRLLVAERSGIANRWPFAIVLTILLLTLTFLILSRPKPRAFLVK